MNRTWKMFAGIPILWAMLSTVAVLKFDFVIVSIPMDANFHFSMMTVNALFGGFLYSNYGMLVGLLDNETIQKVKGTSIMTRRNTQVLCGIVYATLSVVCGLFIALVGIKDGVIWKWTYYWAVNSEVVFMIASMIFYLLSLKEMNQLVKALYKSGGHLSKSEVAAIKSKVLKECETNTDV